MNEMGEWIQQVLEPILDGRMPDPTNVERLGGIALLSADTDRIKEYVFESAKLPEIRGGSMILDDLNQGWPREDYQIDDRRKPENLREIFLRFGLPTRRSKDDKGLDCIIYAGGGSLLALVPPGLAEELIPEIEALYPGKTSAATITCVCRRVTLSDILGQVTGPTHADLLALQEQLSADEWQRIARFYQDSGQESGQITAKHFALRQGFGRLMTVQSTLLRRRKQEKAMLPLFEAVPYARRCQSCGKRPANAIDDSLGEERYLCSVCVRKVERSRDEQGKKEWTRQFEDYLRQHVEIGHKYLGQLDLQDVQGAADLSEIASAATGRAEGYIGFIYADGNDIGRQIEGAVSLNEYGEKSEALRREVPEFVYQALGKHLRAKKNVRRRVKGGRSISVNIHPFEIITIGGDDLLLIVPGDQALAIALNICLAFETSQRLVDLFDRPTLSAGVVIAESHTPIYFLRELAEQLLKSAKKGSWEFRAKTAQDPGRQQGTVDFLIMKSQSTLSTNVRHLRGSPPLLFTSSDIKERRALTAKPYSLADLEKLLNTAYELKAAGFSRSWLHNLYRALTYNRLAASIYYLYQFSRVSKSRRAKLNDIHQQWGVGFDNGQFHSVPPWRWRRKHKEFNEYDTPWPDFIEVMEFLPD